MLAGTIFLTIIIPMSYSISSLWIGGEIEIDSILFSIHTWFSNSHAGFLEQQQVKRLLIPKDPCQVEVSQRRMLPLQCTPSISSVLIIGKESIYRTCTKYLKPPPPMSLCPCSVLFSGSHSLCCYSAQKTLLCWNSFSVLHTILYGMFWNKQLSFVCIFQLGEDKINQTINSTIFPLHPYVSTHNSPWEIITAQMFKFPEDTILWR